MTDRNPLIPELPGAQAILVVDDAPVVRRLTYRLLAEAGYRVFEAASATEALEVLGMARGQVKLVLIDVVLPDVGGVDLARLVRDAAPDAGVVFMSAFPAEVLVRQGLRDPRVPFIAKPFTREELLTVAAEALASRAPGGDPAHRITGQGGT
ncbi:MAG TPA: response regulator [Gemmatimonadales bacterium]